MKELETMEYSQKAGLNAVYIKLIEIDGHKYIVGSYGSHCDGAFDGGAGAALTILHAESCPCKEKKNI